MKKHRDVARCDGCGALVLAYDNEKDFRSTVSEFEARRIAYSTEQVGALFVLAKLS